MAKKKHQPPAKIKYDKTHPTVSIRVSQELKKQLDEIKDLSGKSVGDILREALELQAPSTKHAFTQGYIKAKKDWGSPISAPYVAAQYGLIHLRKRKPLPNICGRTDGDIVIV